MRQYAQTLALNHEKDELNSCTNTNWQRCKDGKKLWERIDWKGKCVVYQPKDISPSVITPYFKNIFQSEKLNDAPAIDNVLNQLEHYNLYIPLLDDTPSIDEVNAAITTDRYRHKPRWNFTRYTQNPSTCAEKTHPTPHGTMFHIRVSCHLEKPTVTTSDPKLRGIAIGPALSRIYSIILNTRFCRWFIPNKEEAVFRKGQGCLLQIFTVYLLMELSKSTKQELFIALMDYEKAFDFLNRPKLINKMMERGIGRNYAHALYDMYTHNIYTKIIANRIRRGNRDETWCDTRKIFLSKLLFLLRF